MIISYDLLIGQEEDAFTVAIPRPAIVIASLYEKSRLELHYHLDDEFFDLAFFLVL
jgi:hypothetical protein